MLINMVECLRGALSHVPVGAGAQSCPLARRCTVHTHTHALRLAYTHICEHVGSGGWVRKIQAAPVCPSTSALSRVGPIRRLSSVSFRYFCFISNSTGIAGPVATRCPSWIFSPCCHVLVHFVCALEWIGSSHLALRYRIDSCAIGA